MRLLGAALLVTYPDTTRGGYRAIQADLSFTEQVLIQKQIHRGSKVEMHGTHVGTNLPCMYVGLYREFENRKSVYVA